MHVRNIIGLGFFSRIFLKCVTNNNEKVRVVSEGPGSHPCCCPIDIRFYCLQ